MSRPCSLQCVALCAASLVLIAFGAPTRAEPAETAQAAGEAEAQATPAPGPPGSVAREAEERIAKALGKRISVDFQDTPLQEAIAFLEETCGIPILLDLRALDQVGIEPEARVSLQVKDISLRSVLSLMLGRLDLTYVIRQEVLQITTPEEAETQLTTRVYPVGDLVGQRDESGERTYGFEPLSDLVFSCIRPENWDNVGGPGSIATAECPGIQAFVVRQTCDVHDEIAGLLAALREMVGQAADGKLPEPILMDAYWPDKVARQRIRDVLARKVSCDFLETPLEEVIAHWGKAAETNLLLDVRALDDVGIPLDVPVTRSASGVSLRQALRQMLRDLDLTYIIEDEVILVTTPEEYERMRKVGIYPVGDLITRSDDSGQVADDAKPMIDVLTRTVGPLSWDDVGGPGCVRFARLADVPTLVIAQTDDIHDQIGRLLAALRTIAKKGGEGEVTEPIMLDEATGEDALAAAAIRKALEQEGTFDFIEAPLFEVLDYVKKTSGVDVEVDGRALDDAGVPTEMPVTIHVSGISLRSALALVLEPRGLMWVIENGTLLITTPEEAETRLIVGVYPAGDLVVCRDEHGKLWDDFDSLVEVIVSTVDQSVWDESGPMVASGTFGAPKVLVVADTRENHEKIAELLRDLRSVAAASGEDRQPPRRSRPQPPGPPEISGAHGFF
ncbi:MAG TPA: hypothetical protein VMY37_11245 [Thermoguttaceae bacterium]|nr:hypothetical protein [Thermoguttaceae bacterium]